MWFLSTTVIIKFHYPGAQIPLNTSYSQLFKCVFTCMFCIKWEASCDNWYWLKIDLKKHVAYQIQTIFLAILFLLAVRLKHQLKYGSLLGKMFWRFSDFTSFSNDRVNYLLVLLVLSPENRNKRKIVEKIGIFWNASCFSPLQISCVCLSYVRLSAFLQRLDTK